MECYAGLFLGCTGHGKRDGGQHGYPCPSECSRRGKKNGGQAAQGLGRSRGGFSTKVHVSVDGLGNPLRLRLTGGERHDITQATALLEGYTFEYVLADRGYDADDFIEFILAQ